MPIEITIGPDAGWFGLSTELWAGVIGAMVGAVVGGLISLSLQMLATKAQRKLNDELRLETRAALGHTLLAKLSSVHASLSHLKNHIEASHPEKHTGPDKAEWWGTLQPLAGSWEQIHISPEEITLFSTLNRFDIFNQLLEIERAHNTAQVLMAEYRVVRDKLRDRLPPADSFNGPASSTGFTDEEDKRARPFMIEANSLAEFLSENAGEWTRQAFVLMQLVLGALQQAKVLPLTLKLETDPPASRSDSHAAKPGN